MSEINLFEFATRNKLRFASKIGELTIEQLWDVPLRSTDGLDLNAIAKAANQALKNANEESFVQPTRTPLHAKLEATLEIVKHIIAVKLSDEEAVKRRAANKEERERLLEALDEKQADELKALSKTVLKKRIRELDAEI